MKISPAKLAYSLIFYLSALVLTGFSFLRSSAQSPMVKEETATCKITLNAAPQPNGITAKTPGVPGKIYQPKFNTLGYFDRVSQIKPFQSLSIEMSYPEGRAGDRVSIMVADGGTLDNGETVKVARLDKQLKFSFGFRVTQNSGIYRLILRKGFDSKVVQLWVGAEENNLTKN